MHTEKKTGGFPFMKRLAASAACAGAVLMALAGGQA
jgi:hypothetical protein